MIAGGLVLVASGVLLVVGAIAVVAALLAGLALALPARGPGSTPLRAAVNPSERDSSRRAALGASLRWVRAFVATSRGPRLARILLAAGAMPAVLGSARWRRRAVLLTGPGAGLRVLERRDGSWRLVDVAAWPLGAQRARPLLERVCAAADAAGVSVTLTASSSKVAVAVYAPLGFRASSNSVRMIRPPQPVTTAAEQEAVPEPTRR